MRAGRTPCRQHRRDTDGAHPLGSAGAGGRASAGVAAPHPAPQPAEEAWTSPTRWDELHLWAVTMLWAFGLNGKRTPGDRVPLCLSRVWDKIDLRWSPRTTLPV